MATKRMVRANLKVADMCDSDPESVTRLLIEGGYSRRHKGKLPKHDFGR